jgi:hypothetical protein
VSPTGQSIIELIYGSSKSRSPSSILLKTFETGPEEITGEYQLWLAVPVQQARKAAREISRNIWAKAVSPCIP